MPKIEGGVEQMEEKTIKRAIISFVMAAMCFFAVHAGDAAVFSEVGFSEDGKYYLFGEYGRTDKKFQGYAEIYTVDVEANKFVAGGVFCTSPSKATQGKAGTEVYDTLSVKAFSTINRYNCTKTEANRVLYICDSPNKMGEEKIEFRDFTRVLGDGEDERRAYSVHLNQSVKGKGASSASSFYIVLEKLGINGAVISSQQIGSPQIVRKGVTGYKIARISCDKSRSALVFVVEKTMEDETGVLIRYMVETAKVRL